MTGRNMRSWLAVGALAALATVARSTIAHAEPPAEVTADEAVALYREQSARLRAARSAIDVAAADLVEARIYPNPSVGISSARTVAGTDTIGGSQHALSLDIPLLIGRQRGKREDAARARIEATRADVEADTASAELAIRGLFVKLAAAEERAAMLATSVDDARRVREIVARRSAAGASSPYAVERTELAIAALASQLDEAGAEASSASSALAAAVGLPGWRPRAAGRLEAAVLERGAAVAPGHPSLVAAERSERVAHADERRARADAIPTPSLGLQAFATTDPSGVAVTAGFAVPLPLFDRNQGAVARARAEAKRAAHEREARAVELAAELDGASRVLAARRDALARFQADALQRLTRLREMAEASYRSGQGGIVELLDALDAITEARLREVELRAAAVEAALAVRAASRGR